MADPNQMIRSSRRCVALAFAGGVLAAITGCEGRDEAGAGIVKARATLVALGSSGRAAPSSVRERAYAEVAREMQALSGSEGAVASARLIAAQATMGQGEIEAAAAREAEAAGAHLTSRARAVLELHVKQDALAASMEGHDFSKRLDEAARERAKLESERTAARGALEEINGALKQLHELSERFAGEARTKRDLAGQLRATLEGAPAVARLSIVEQAAKHQRDADGLEVRQSEVELQAQPLRHRAEEAERDIELLSRRIELAAQAGERIESHAKLLAQQSSQARADAGASASELAAAFEELSKHIGEKLTPAYQSACAKYESAGSLAQQASRVAPGAAKELSGSAMQALGALHSGYAGTLENAAALASRIGGLRSMPSASKYTEAGGGFSRDARTARDAAASAFAQAGASFQSAGSPGASSELFKKLGEKLSPLPESPAPEQPAPEAAPTDATHPTEPAPAEPVASPGDAPAPDEPPAPADAPTSDPKRGA